MASKKYKVFDGLYSQLQTIEGKTVLFDKNGAPSVIFRIKNPVQQFSSDPECYNAFHGVLVNLVQVLGEGYALQKQDIFATQKFHTPSTKGMEFLSKCYFNFFEGRKYTSISSYLIITQEGQTNRYIEYNEKKWKEFINKVEKVSDILRERGVWARMLSQKEVNEYLHRFLAVNFRKGHFSVNNFKCSDECLKIGDQTVRSFPIVDIDEINLPNFVKPYSSTTINGYQVAQDFLGFIPFIPFCDVVIYNQVVQIPPQRKMLAALTTKAKRHQSLPDASNRVAQADIEQVLEYLAADSNLLVKCNFNILASCPSEYADQVATYIETKLFDLGIIPSKAAYNQLELFISSFPGNAFNLNKEYDLFLTLMDTALSLFFKERLKESEETPIKTYYTDRQGLPICIDITGKEGSWKLTDNSNFFCIGPSGSGKSFHMNSVVRQLLEQNTDVVMVDTGDSYEGICSYFGGTYISYTKERPISMNPFKITDEEYTENFGEKKNFLKSLIYHIYKGAEVPSKIEDTLINQVIVEYYDTYFHPFEGFSEEQITDLRKKLLLGYRMDTGLDAVEEEMDTIDKTIESEEQEKPVAMVEQRAIVRPEEMRKIKLLRQCRSLLAIIKDEASSDPEKENASYKLEAYKKELYEATAIIKVNKEIERIERQKLRLKVRELSFNSFYEFAVERIPQICREDKIEFHIRNFAAILKPFYRGGEMDNILNSDIDLNLFNEKFIIFEIDKIKDDPILFPIVVLIIMDVFIQKMRIKKGRKALIIEEAWKAIASPTMAEYIKYVYKTVRKFHGIAGVVTQELNDVIDSPIVKEAIINNSDIKILLDQTKFKDRYDQIAAILGLTELQRRQIFTINALDNHAGRNPFKEVWISRGLHSDVYGVEEPPECYWAYTTERAEKEALKIYLRHYGNIQDAILHIEADRKKKGVNRYLDFANLVNHHNNIMPLWKESS